MAGIFEQLHRGIFVHGVAVFLLIGTQAMAQDSSSVATSSVGQVGQRQTGEQGPVSVKPMERIDTRIHNRVQSRVRNRLDRFYDPRANAISPFRVAGEEVRTAGAPKPR